MIVRRARIAFLLAALAALMLAAGAGTASAATAGTTGRTYVALGDSYAAGYGISPSTGAPVPGCAQSARDYPHQVATRLGLRLTDVSCSGAVAANIDTTPQQTASGTAPVQDTALSASTQIVSLTIGGNDLGFAAIAQTCLAASPAGPLLVPLSKGATDPNCKSVYDANGQDTLTAAVASTVVPHLDRALADIKAKAPNAKIFVLDYPAISTTPANYPATGSCFSTLSLTGPTSFPITDVDTPYLQQVQANLNAAEAARAKAAGATFVETYPQSLPHSACAGTADPWMNGVGLQAGPNGQPTAQAYPGSFHPNLEGATQLADELAAAVTAAFPAASASPAPSASPTATATPPASNGPGSSGLPPLANTGQGHPARLAGIGALLLTAGVGLTWWTRRRTG